MPLLLALSVARLWLMPMSSSFWLDETATVFVARHGPDDPSLAGVAPQAWKSLYYPLAHASEVLFGFSEVSYRIPSALAMAAALALIARLASRLIHPGAGWFAVFACVALPGINYHAADARPYALGILVAAASFTFLVQWLDAGGWISGMCFVFFAALLWRVHLLYWPGYLVFAAYTITRKVNRETPVSWQRIAAVFTVLGLALVPVLLDALTLYRDAKAHVFATPPSWRALAGSLKLNLIAACGAGAWILKRWRGWPANPKPLARSSQVLVAAWWLCPPLCLFAYSRITGNSIFVARYVSLALPGVALAATAAAALFVPAPKWKPLAAVLAIGGLAFVGQWSQLRPRHHNSDWRAAARAVNEVVGSTQTPVICPSPYVEAVPPVWRPDYPLPGFLYSHLSVYPVRGRPLLFPFADSAEADANAIRLSREVLTKTRRFVIYGWEPQVHFWCDWFAARSELAGWRRERLGPFADVDVFVFQAPN